MESLSSAPLMILHHADCSAFSLWHAHSLNKQERSVNSLPVPFSVNLRYSAGMSLKDSDCIQFILRRRRAAHSVRCIRTDGGIYICRGCFKIVSTEDCWSCTMKMDLIRSKFNYSNTVIAMTSSLNALTWPCGRCVFHVFRRPVSLKT